MILFVAYVAFLHGLSTPATIGFSLLVLVMFTCVILHELGHSMAARKYGIPTHDIIISPIGGLARLKEIPEKPSQELVIAFAGPLVNVIIAGVTAVYLIYIANTDLLPSSDDFELLSQTKEFVKFVFLMNIALFVFNLIPAFPMDGGRVLRALLATVMDRVKATRIAMWIGRVLAVGFIAVAYYTTNFTWGLIGVFVFVMAGKEYMQVRYQRKSKAKVKLMMRSVFSTFQIDDDYENVLSTYKSSDEKNFIVLDKETIVGAVPEEFIKEVLASSSKYQVVSDLMTTKVALISPNASISEVAHMMNDNGIAICAIKDPNDQIIGVLDRDDIIHWYNSK